MCTSVRDCAIAYGMFSVIHVLNIPDVAEFCINSIASLLIQLNRSILPKALTNVLSERFSVTEFWCSSCTISGMNL